MSLYHIVYRSTSNTGHAHAQEYNSEIASKVVRKNITHIVKYQMNTTKLAMELLAQDLITDHLCGEILNNSIEQERFLFEVYKVIKIGKGKFPKFLQALKNTERGDEVADFLQQTYGMLVNYVDG